MALRESSKPIESFVIGAVIAVTLFVSPWNSIDPVNLPKLTLLAFLSIVGLGLISGKKAFLSYEKGKFLYLFLTFFVTSLMISFITSEQEFSLKFYGLPGRNTGFLAYLCLLVLLYVVATIASSTLVRKFCKSLIATGAFLGIYGLAQSIGFDFFDYLNGYGSDVFGTFGNPNFQSAFMGIVASVSITLGALSREKLQLRFLYLGVTLIALLNIQLSSWQGFFVFGFGVLTSLLIYVFQNGYRKTFLVMSSALTLLVVFVSLALFNLGPLASILYKASLGAREIYWQAAINMIRQHPLTGVGPDGYIDWFRRSRSKEVSEGPNLLVADSAHNIPLDVGASGGIPLLLSYLGLILLVVLAILVVLRRGKVFDVYFTSLVSAWVGYQAQSLISINQLGVGVWGWGLSGLLIGYALVTSDVQDSKVVKNKMRLSGQAPSPKSSVNPFLIAATVMSSLLAWFVSTPPYFAAAQYFSALKSGDAIVLQEATTLTPSNRRNYFETARIFADNKLFDRSLVLLREATVKYPDYFELWQLWAAIPSASTEEVKRAKAELKRLDPNNPSYR
jgi:O-antigen ligase